jgi:hypothetical protein
VKTLCTGSQGAASDESKFNSPPPVCGGVEERCKMALQHVALGLQCLQYFDTSDQDDSRQQERVQENSQFQVCRVAALGSSYKMQEAR